MYVLGLVVQCGQISEPLLECLQLSIKSFFQHKKLFINRLRGRKTEGIGRDITQKESHYNAAKLRLEKRLSSGLEL